MKYYISEFERFYPSLKIYKSRPWNRLKDWIHLKFRLGSRGNVKAFVTRKCTTSPGELSAKRVSRWIIYIYGNQSIFISWTSHAINFRTYVLCSTKSIRPRANEKWSRNSDFQNLSCFGPRSHPCVRALWWMGFRNGNGWYGYFFERLWDLLIEFLIWGLNQFVCVCWRGSL